MYCGGPSHIIVPEKPFTAWLPLLPARGILEWGDAVHADLLWRLFLRQMDASWTLGMGNVSPHLTRLGSRAVDSGSS